MNNITLKQSMVSQRGAALITSLVFLVILTMLALSSMNTNILDEKMASNSQEKNRAFQTAETTLNIAINDPLTFNTAGYDDGVVDNLGTYNADATWSSEFIKQIDATAVFSEKAQGGTYSYFKLHVNAATESNAKSVIHAGAWHKSAS